MYVFGNREDASFALELNLISRVCRQLDLSGFCAKSSHHISDRCALIKPGKHESSIGGIFPDPQLLHIASEDLIAGISIPVLEGGIDIEEAPILQCRNRKRKGARLEYPLKLLLERSPAVFGPRQRRFCPFEFGKPRFKSLTVDACGFVEPRILNRSRCGNSKQFGTAEMVLGVEIGLGCGRRKGTRDTPPNPQAEPRARSVVACAP